MKRVCRALGAALLPLIAASLLQAAAPWIMIISGSFVKEQIVVTKREQNLTFMLAVQDGVETDPGSLIGRPYADLSLYWGPAWKEFVEHGGRPETLEHGQANQRGQFYPPSVRIPLSSSLITVRPERRATDQFQKMV